MFEDGCGASMEWDEMFELRRWSVHTRTRTLGRNKPYIQPRLSSNHDKTSQYISVPPLCHIVRQQYKLRNLTRFKMFLYGNTKNHTNATLTEEHLTEEHALNLDCIEISVLPLILESDVEQDGWQRPAARLHVRQPGADCTSAWCHSDTSWTPWQQTSGPSMRDPWVQCRPLLFTFNIIQSVFLIMFEHSNSTSFLTPTAEGLKNKCMMRMYNCCTTSAIHSDFITSTLSLSNVSRIQMSAASSHLHTSNCYWLWYTHGCIAEQTNRKSV